MEMTIDFFCFINIYIEFKSFRYKVLSVTTYTVRNIREFFVMIKSFVSSE